MPLSHLHPSSMVSVNNFPPTPT